MAFAKSSYGKVFKGHTIPYGTMVGVSEELRQAYYYYGYKEDSMLPEFPCLPYEEETYESLEEKLYKKELAEHVRNMLDTLTPREAKVLRMRFGVELNCDYTLEEVGRTLELSRERIRQIEGKALRNMKHPSREDVLRYVWMPEEYYETTEEKKKEALSIQRRWQEARKKRDEEIEKGIRERAFVRGEFLTPKKRELWRELRPAVADALWVKNLRVEKPDIYQELKELVVKIWEDEAAQIWKQYTGKDI